MSRDGEFEKKYPDREGQERAMRLMEALSGVDERLLERCGRERKTRPLWRNMRAVAAAACLAAVGAVSWGGYQLSNLKMGSADLSGGAAENCVTEEGNEASPREEVSGDAAQRENEAKEEETVTSRPESTGDTVEDEKQSDVLSGAEADSKERAGQEMAADNGTQSGSVGMPENGGEEETPVDVESCLPLKSEKLTEAESRSREALGAYVPGVLPEGYVFEEAYTLPDASQANLTVCWTRGMDSIMLHLEKPEKLPATVDVARRESYDQRLYEIPYGETVPEDYRESFWNPVFAAQDFTLEIVESRMKSYDDAGDTDTPRGNFGVLYPDGVVVRFNGRGTAQEIWEMFCSMGESE